MNTQITITADVIGAYWWPIGEEWEKPFESFDVNDYEARCIGGERAHGRLSLRQAVDSFTTEHSGDSSAGVTLRDGIVTVRMTRGTRRVERDFPLTMFPSIADYLAPEDA